MNKSGCGAIGQLSTTFQNGRQRTPERQQKFAAENFSECLLHVLN